MPTTPEPLRAGPLRYTTALVDLDGTIADSAPGITATLAWTFEQLGLPVPTPAEMILWVGPPIMDSFRDRAHLDLPDAHRALEIYRARYLESGAGNATIFPGIERVLRAMRTSGMSISLATSKPEKPARLILEHFGILELFDEITGASEDEVRSAKADVVEEALIRLRARDADLSRTVMIGDRHHDIEGAAEHDVPSIFVTWGYGAPAERAGAIAVVDTPDALLEALGLPDPFDLVAPPA